MDGLSRSNAMVFVLGATNLPWELDMVSWGREMGLRDSDMMRRWEGGGKAFGG